MAVAAIIVEYSGGMPVAEIRRNCSNSSNALDVWERGGWDFLGRSIEKRLGLSADVFVCLIETQPEFIFCELLERVEKEPYPTVTQKQLIMLRNDRLGYSAFRCSTEFFLNRLPQY